METQYYLEKMKEFMTEPVYRARYLSRKGFFKDDEKYLRMLYKRVFKKELNLRHPQTFNEKNNWRKLYDRRPVYTQMVDKYRSKEYVKDRAGDGYTFPLLGVWDKPEHINFETLPDRFVLKSNHGGGILVCRDKSAFDKGKAIRELKIMQNLDYYCLSREWPYKNVKRKIIAEQYMGENLTDYKNYCFNGQVAYTFVWENRSKKDGRKPDAYFCGAYDRKWMKSGIKLRYPSLEKNIERPDCYDEMIKIAQKVSRGFPFVRVDCYVLDHRVFVGEMTLFPWGGFQLFEDYEWDYILGDMEILPSVRKAACKKAARKK